MDATNDKYSYLTEAEYTQEEAWKFLKIGKTTYHKLKKKGKIKTRTLEGTTLQRVSREHLIELKETLFKEFAVPAQEPTHLRGKRKRKPKEGDPPSE